MSFDPDYYLSRLNAERAAAVHAASEEARAVHEALADEYAELLVAYGQNMAGKGGADLIRPPLSTTAEVSP